MIDRNGIAKESKTKFFFVPLGRICKAPFGSHTENLLETGIPTLNKKKLRSESINIFEFSIRCFCNSGALRIAF
ncbi:hypothetical protein CH380_13570 [Leptospira adleri]|uniref:Uncharacterized protein n=1 Tax=Leptospira adleri TaxID=2023186 RepID=A0A2M9YMJ4_9LEPT|nr:hypothetical protein CH380_13570 [Leptospira adleri]PJZ60301.1 hypothetical protein CH376_19110 [Leptospira adleri]